MNRSFYLLGRRNALKFSLFSICFFFSLFLTVPTAYAQLSGTYTIGGADGTYANFTEAASALEAQGVSGPVTFKVRPATYKEQLRLTAFAGNSCETPVIFEGEGVAPGQVILQAPEGTSNTVQLNGPDGISFRNMSFTSPGKVFVTNPGTNCFSLENTIVKSLGGILVHALSGAEAGGDHHVYRNNTFQGGITGILKENVATWNPQAPQFDDGLIIEGNQFRGQGNAAVKISGQQEFTISNNQAEGSGSGILVSNSWYGKEISGNNIKANVGDYKGVGISLNSAAAARITENYIRLQEGGFGMDITTGKTSGNEILLANNIIEVNGYDARGHNYFPISNLVGLDIANNYPNKLKIYHNTVRVAGYSEDVPNISFSASGESNSLYIKNNSFANHSNGTVMLIGSLAAIAEMDYNNINGDYAQVFARLGGKEINGLAAWQSATGFDKHSISVNPGPPEDPVDALTGAGIYLDEVPKDIFEVMRNDPPAIGAVEGGDLRPALSGVYTIGGENSDYSTFTAAIAALETYGIKDSVLFKVQPGEYHEQLNISEFRNKDLRMTFEGAGNDSTAVVLTYPLDNVLVIRDSKNVTFRNMTLSSGVYLSNSSGLLFERNVIVGGVNAHSVGNDVYRNNLFKEQGIKKSSKGYNQTHGRLYKDGPMNIEGNSFEVYGSAISLFAQTGVKINNNQIRVGETEKLNQSEAIELSSGSTDEINNNTIVSYLPGATGIYMGGAYRGKLPEEIMNNKISLLNGGTGISFWHGATGSSLVANNLISIKADDSSRGIAVYSSGAGINFFFNSVYLYGNDSDSKVFYFEVDYEEPLNVHFKNNIFANLAGGYVLYEELYDNIKRLASSDYNDLYTNGETFARWDEQTIPDLSQWQALTGFDTHSLSVNPQFKSAENLLPGNSVLSGAGTAIDAVDTDFYGKPRSSPPAIGAVEFNPDTPGNEEPAEALAGTYTIGGENPDFATFSKAAAVLDSFGISGPVTFKVRPGTYEEQLKLTEISGSSCDQTIVFEGESRDSTAAKITYAGPSVLIEGTDGITFRYLTLDLIRIMEGSDCITLENNQIQGTLISQSGPGELAGNEHVYRNNNMGGIRKIKTGPFNPDSPDFDEGLVISGNTITTVAGNGIELNAQKGIIINDNTITVLGERDGEAAIDLKNSWYGKEIRGNNITVKSFYGRGAGIRSENGIPERVSENRISMEHAENIENPYWDDEIALGGGTALVVSTGKTDSGEVLIANNLIKVDGYDRAGQLGTLRGIHIRETSADDGVVKVYHNNVRTLGYQDLSASSAIYSEAEAKNSIHMLNNIFVDQAYGYKINVLHPTAVAVSDYNNFSGSNSAYKWGNQEAGSLPEWQKLTGLDEHSLSVDPGFESYTGAVATNPELAGAGISVEEVDYDINGILRKDPPSIGAIELEVPGPVAKAGKDRTITLPVKTFTLSGMAQVSDARIVAYRWEKISGPSVTMSNQNTANVNLSDFEEGEYIFRFSATDSKGRTGSDELTLTVKEGDLANLVPEAKAGKDKTITLPDNSIILSGLAYTTEGRFVAFRWEKISGPSVSMTGDRTANVKLSDLTEGEYVFRFSATNDRGLTGTDEMTLTVLPAENTNQPPVVGAGKDVTITTAYGQYFLSGTGHDPDGRFTAFRWEKVSGPAVSMSGHNTANLKITDFEAGEYVFRFSATDNGGATASDEVMVRVKEAENAAPSLAASTSVTAYPNTFQSYINVEIEAEEPEEYQIMVYDMLGKIFYTNSFVPDNFNNATHTIDFSGQVLREGAYYIRIENQEGSFRKMLKVVKTN